MKKAKIMLMAILVMAVVGGALAFKANKFSGNLRCTTTTVSTTICPLTLYSTNHPTTILRCTSIGAPKGALCTFKTVRFDN